MREAVAAFESISQNIQAIGLLLPALGCCYAQFTRKAGLPYFTSSKYFSETDINLLGFLKQKFMVHDHGVDGIEPNKREKFVVVIPRKDGTDKVLVSKEDLIITDNVGEGEKIPETDFIHNHKGKTGVTGPWEY